MRIMNTTIKYEIKEYDPSAGDIGRGHTVTLAEFEEAAIQLLRDGFNRMIFPHVSDQWIVVYGLSGAPSGMLWTSFVKEVDGKHFVCSFELPIGELKDNTRHCALCGRQY